MDLLPTNSCYDDALDYLESLARDPSTAWIIRRPDTFLVHGIALMPEQGTQPPGTPYAHAWVELADVVIDAGLLDGRRVWFRRPRADYYAHLRIQSVTRYSMPEALAENRRTGHYGPWKPEYRALLRSKSSTGETVVDV